MALVANVLAQRPQLQLRWKVWLQKVPYAAFLGITAELIVGRTSCLSLPEDSKIDWKPVPTCFALAG